MALQPGTRLGPYEVVSPLGAGGMGEVYRARDARLERTVAIKVLPSHIASNPDARQRFEREALNARSGAREVRRGPGLTEVPGGASVPAHF
jgi:serine/threonine protein kinase